MACGEINGFALTSDARVFIAPTGVGCGRAYEYHSCMKVTGLSKEIGESTPFYCPDPDRSGAFIEVATIQGEESRWSLSLTGPKPFGKTSTLRRLLQRRGCEFDLQVHFGRCVDPTQFDDYVQSIVIEGARISDYSTDDLVALNPGENAIINETVSITARYVYEVFRMNIFRTGLDVTDDLMALAAVQCQSYSSIGCGEDCGGCQDECTDFYALTVPHITQSNGQMIYIAHTHDGGISWDEYQIPCAAVVTNPLESYELVCAGAKILVSLNELGGIGHVYSIPTADIIAGTDTGNTFVRLGFTIYDTFYARGSMWAVGAAGRVSALDVNSLTEVVIEDGAVFTGDWYAVSGCNDANMIFGGAGGQLAFRRNGSALQRATIVVDGITVDTDFTAVMMKSTSDWYVGDVSGTLYCTSNCGATWRQASIFGGCIKAIRFPTNNIGYIAVGHPAAIYRTSDGGTTWTRIEDNNSQIPSQAILTDLSVSQDNPNQFVASGRIATDLSGACVADGGLSTAGDGGLLLIGQVNS